MVNRELDNPIIGEVIRYTHGFNVLLRESVIVVKVDKTTIRIPIDRRQQQLIQKEYPLGSNIALRPNNGKWQILSRLAQEVKVIRKIDHDCRINDCYV